MKFGLLVVSVVVIVLFAPDLRGAERVPVLVELFTSEGCSSCPPADALLASLGREQSSSAEIIVLGEHVDYWNELGWKDRFSAHQYSSRQEDYARRFGLDSVYTPQMVIDGRRQFVGNDSHEAHESIAAAARSAKPVKITLQRDGGVLRIAANRPGGEPAVLLLAISEDNLTTQVKAGENGGRELRHQAVVRSLRQIGVLRDGSFTGDEPLKLDSGWLRPNLKAIVFAQDPGSGAILGAAVQRLD